MEAGIIKIIIKGISYLKAVEFEYDVSTLYRYTRYFLNRADKLYEQTKQIILNLSPDIEYEKSIEAENSKSKKAKSQTKSQEKSQDLLVQTIKLWELLKQILKNKLPEIDELDTFTGLMYLQGLQST